MNEERVDTPIAVFPADTDFAERKRKMLEYIRAVQQEEAKVDGIKNKKRRIGAASVVATLKTIK